MSKEVKPKVQVAGLKVGTRVEIDHEGNIQKFLVDFNTTKKQYDAFYKSLEAPVEAK